jgi:outer membrane protein OmpA-like peptidoglycan-associated protein
MTESHDSLSSKEQTKKDRFSELHDLVTGLEQQRLNKIESRLDDPERLADEISNVLHSAVSKSSKKSEALVSAFTPVVEKSVRESVGKNTTTFAHLLYPVIRPAIQKAITSTFKRMIQSFNKVIEYSFSFRGLRWRLESIITRKPFAEVVLLHSLVYSVNQVFLIRIESGILLCQTQSILGLSQDGDMVSGMLKAIQDFVHDSFKLPDEGIETIQVGDFSIWIVEGEFALLAGVVQGNAPESLRTDLKHALDKIEHQFREQFRTFNGDTTNFEKAGYLLEPCLKTEIHEKKKRVPLFSWVLLLALFVFVGYMVNMNIKSRIRWSSFLSEVETIPSVIITDKGRKEGKYFVKGLRDPMTSDPMSRLGQFNLDIEEVKSQWTFYQSLLPQFILERAHRILAPPTSVRLEFKQGVLIATGRASSQWKKEATILVRSIIGVKRFHQTGTTDLDAQDFHNLLGQLLKQRFLFIVGSDKLLPGQEENLDSFINNMGALLEVADKLNSPIKIVIMGHTDTSGPDVLNKKIRIARSRALLNILKSKGIAIEYFIAVSAPAMDRKVGEDVKLDQYQRAVTFKATIDNKPYKNKE